MRYLMIFSLTLLGSLANATDLVCQSRTETGSFVILIGQIGPKTAPKRFSQISGYRKGGAVLPQVLGNYAINSVNTSRGIVFSGPNFSMAVTDAKGNATVRTVANGKALNLSAICDLPGSARAEASGENPRPKECNECYGQPVPSPFCRTVCGCSSTFCGGW